MTRDMLRTELLKIYEVNGELTAELVVEAARPKTSPLHGELEWDDKRAGREHRLWQAGNLIRSVRIQVTHELPNGEIVDYKVREWTAAQRAGIPDMEPGSYLPTEAIGEPARTILLKRMQREMHNMRRRYEHLREFWALIDAFSNEHSEGDGGDQQAG